MKTKKGILTPLEATKKVESIKLGVSDRALSETLGIARTTLYKRLKDNAWSKAELFYITHLLKSKL
jgi:hypothetical protein